MSDDDFVRYVVERLGAKRRRDELIVKDARMAKEANDRWLAERAEIRKAQAPLTWQALRRWMKKFCEVCKGKDGKNFFEFKGMEGNQFEVVEVPPRFTLHVGFDPQQHTITYKSKSSKKSLAHTADPSIPNTIFALQVDEKQLLFTHEPAGVVMTVEEMGQTLIRDLLGPN